MGETPSPALCPPHPVSTPKSWSTRDLMAWAWFPCQIPTAWPGTAFKGREGKTRGPLGSQVGGFVGRWDGSFPRTAQFRHVRCGASSHALAVCCGEPCSPASVSPASVLPSPPRQVRPDSMQKASFLGGKSLCEGLLPHYHSLLESIQSFASS